MPEAAREPGWQGMARRRGALARLLWPLSLIYRVLLAGRRIAYALDLARVETLPVPVLVVGNVVVGGAGKTPTTIALVQHLRERGRRVGVISRGHGRRDGDVLEVLDDSDPARCGDEPLLIRRHTGVPVWVGRQRAAAGRALLAAHADVDCLVCDDGLQHWPLRSDLRVAVFDDRGLGNGWLLPAGLLREPWPVRSPAHAPHLVLCQSRDATAIELPLPAGLPRFHARRRLAGFAVDAAGQRRALSEFADHPTLALAAIARPDVFFSMLAAAGVTPQRCLPLPDHAGTSALQQALSDWHGDVLCTEKDLVKLGSLPERLRAWAVPLALDIEPAFFAAVDARLPAPRG
jgi:tetraacyldisaccharide 4'-kinase